MIWEYDTKMFKKKKLNAKTYSTILNKERTCEGSVCVWGGEGKYGMVIRFLWFRVWD